MTIEQQKIIEVQSKEKMQVRIYILSIQREIQTAEVLKVVVASVKEIANISNALSENIRVQVESIEQADEGMNRISEVVQSNSATAEETSATSQELSAQAMSMDSLVARFQLREE